MSPPYMSAAFAVSDPRYDTEGAGRDVTSIRYEGCNNDMLLRVESRATKWARARRELVLGVGRMGDDIYEVRVKSRQ